MSSKVNFYIKAGLPFKKTIVTSLPTDRDYWLNEGDFEIRFQLREQRNQTSTLILDMLQFCTVELTDPDTVTILFSMTGADTLTITKSGYYDIIISDLLAIDARAYPILDGEVKLGHIVSAAAEVSP